MYQILKSWVKLFQWNLWRKFSICIPYEREMEKPKKKMKAKQIISIAMILYTIHMANLQVYTFEEASSNGSWEICYRIFLSKKRKIGQIKGLISNMWLILYTQYNLSLPNFVPNFRILSQVVHEKSLREKVNRQIYKHCDRKGNYIHSI